MPLSQSPDKGTGTPLAQRLEWHIEGLRFGQWQMSHISILIGFRSRSRAFPVAKLVKLVAASALCQASAESYAGLSADSTHHHFHQSLAKSNAAISMWTKHTSIIQHHPASSSIIQHPASHYPQWGRERHIRRMRPPDQGSMPVMRTAVHLPEAKTCKLGQLPQFQASKSFQLPPHGSESILPVAKSNHTPWTNRVAATFYVYRGERICGICGISLVFPIFPTPTQRLLEKNTESAAFNSRQLGRCLWPQVQQDVLPQSPKCKKKHWSQVCPSPNITRTQVCSATRLSNRTSINCCRRSLASSGQRRPHSDSPHDLCSSMRCRWKWWNSMGLFSRDNPHWQPERHRRSSARIRSWCACDWPTLSLYRFDQDQVKCRTRWDLHLGLTIWSNLFAYVYILYINVYINPVAVYRVRLGPVIFY